MSLLHRGKSNRLRFVCDMRSCGVLMSNAVGKFFCISDEFIEYDHDWMYERRKRIDDVVNE